jgi:hypothetical protein
MSVEAKVSRRRTPPPASSSVSATPGDLQHTEHRTVELAFPKLPHSPPRAAGPVALHAETHIDGGTDAIRADLLRVLYPPFSYTPQLTPDAPIPTDAVEQLTSHLAGIDVRLNEVNNGVLNNADDIATNTSNISSLQTTVSGHTTSIATNTSNITANTNNIATNTSNISNLQASVALLSPLLLPIVVYATSITLQASDAHKLLVMMSSGAQSVTVPPNSSVAFGVGTIIHLLRYAVGQVSVVQGAGVTVRSLLGSLSSGAQYSLMSLIKLDTNEWHLSGTLA